MTTPELRARWVARSSLIAACICFAANCVSNRLLWTQGGGGFAATVSLVVNILTSACLLSGVGLGLAGIILGRRARQGETILLAVIGLCLNLGIIGMSAWFVWVLRSAP